MNALSVNPYPFIKLTFLLIFIVDQLINIYFNPGRLGLGVMGCLTVPSRTMGHEATLRHMSPVSFEQLEAFCGWIHFVDYNSSRA